jgi:hypothetical protein
MTCCRELRCMVSFSGEVFAVLRLVFCRPPRCVMGFGVSVDNFQVGPASGKWVLFLALAVGRQIRSGGQANEPKISIKHHPATPLAALHKSRMPSIFGSSFHEAKLVKVRRFPSALPSLADPLPESSRVLLCARPADISAHSRKVLHPPSREGRLPAAQDYHSPDGRTVDHDHRKRREEDPPRQHQAVA